MQGVVDGVFVLGKEKVIDSTKWTEQLNEIIRTDRFHKWVLSVEEDRAKDNTKAVCLLRYRRGGRLKQFIRTDMYLFGLSLLCIFVAPLWK